MRIIGRGEQRREGVRREGERRGEERRADNQSCLIRSHWSPYLRAALCLRVGTLCRALRRERRKEGGGEGSEAYFIPCCCTVE
jgi:hypothetical protein